MANANAIPFVPESSNQSVLSKYFRYAAVVLLTFAMLWVVVQMLAAREWIFGILVLIFAAINFFIFISERAYVWRYVFPAVAGVTIFVLFPIMYTFGLSFTNYSTANLLSFPQATLYLQNLSYVKEDGVEFGFTLHGDENSYRIVLEHPDTDELFASDPIAMPLEPISLDFNPVAEVATDKLPLKVVIKNRSALDLITAKLPDGTKLTKSGLRAFTSSFPLYSVLDEKTVQNNETGIIFRADDETGYFTSEAGKQLTPGYTVGFGFKNYMRILTNDGMFEPFIGIFTWTIIFSTLSVILTLGLGMVLANIVQWEPIKGGNIFQALLILPYAIPAFISIQVFRGLFNPNFGDINKILDAAFSISPQWFQDPLLAKSMILMVNTWLGYPYMLILCIGLLQSIPKDLYEASAIEGSGPINNFFKITLPLLLKPLLPLLIASFAFNFNNFVVIQLLTEGGPTILGSSPEAGHTDLLVNYAYGLAFTGDRQDFALASAVATFIFMMVGLMAIGYLKFAKIEIKR